MKVVFGSHNPSKVQLYKSLFAPHGIDIVGLDEIDVHIDVEEDGTRPHDNAILKAVAYGEALDMPVVADDSGLFFDDTLVPDELQPRSKVRRVNNRVLSDDEALDYYSHLVDKYGNICTEEYDSYSAPYKRLYGYYEKAVALYINGTTHVCDYRVPKYYINIVSSKRNVGFPLDSMSITPKFNKLTVNLTHEENEVLFAEESVDLVESIKIWADILKNS